MGKKVIVLKFVKILLILILSLSSLTGCIFAGGVETLLYPPKLSNEQLAINGALTEKVGRSIKLKYPKTGDYRSAFIVANIDDDPTDEAIVFYERITPNNTESSIRMNILDQRNDKWASVFDHTGNGIDVERIRLERVGKTNKITIIVGYTTINHTEKNISLYQYDGSMLNTVFQDTYASVEVFDTNNDMYNEIVILQNSSAGKAAKSKLLTFENDNFFITTEGHMDETITEYTSIVHGTLDTDTRALYIDGAKGDGTIQTQIVYCVNGQLRNPLEAERELMSRTSRPIGYLSNDIDNDGIIEIPVLSPAPGYETYDKNDRMWITDWLVFEKYNLVIKNTSYYNITNGYCFMLPSRWKGAVTVKQDPVTDEIIFYKYTGTIEDNMLELMRICTIKKGSGDELIANDYVSVGNKGQKEYLVKLTNKSNHALIPTMSEFIYNFIIL